MGLRTQMDIDRYESDLVKRVSKQRSYSFPMCPINHLPFTLRRTKLSRISRLTLISILICVWGATVLHLRLTRGGQAMRRRSRILMLGRLRLPYGQERLVRASRTFRENLVSILPAVNDLPSYSCQILLFFN